MPGTPLLLLPLRLPEQYGLAPPDRPGEYAVKVEWTFLRAANSLGPYRVEKPGDVGEADRAWMKELLDRSETKFTLPRE